MTVQEIITLMEAAGKNGLSEFEYEEEGQRVFMKKDAASGKVTVEKQGDSAPEPVAQNVNTAEKEKAKDDADMTVTAPMVGTFYVSSSPEKAPFVKEGDAVKKGQVIGVIEAMKLMNEIECPYDGIVGKVLVKNESVVEYGQPLMKIRKM